MKPWNGLTAVFVLVCAAIWTVALVSYLNGSPSAVSAVIAIPPMVVIGAPLLWIFIRGVSE